MTTDNTPTIHRSVMLTAIAALAATAMAILAFASLANAYTPAPVLEVSHELAPTHLAPGATGTFAITTRNLSQTSTSGEITLTAELPAGITVGSFGAFDMTGLFQCPVSVGAATVVCTSTPGGALLGRELPSIVHVFVEAGAGASGSGQSTVEVVGGGDSTPAISTAPYAITSDPAPFGLVRFAGWAVDADGEAARQAGGHPDLTTEIQFSTTPVDGQPAAAENMKDIEIDLPAGLVANPSSLPVCETVQVVYNDGALCPPETQIGTVDLTTTVGSFWMLTKAVSLPLINVEPPNGMPARFAFNLSGVVTYIDPAIKAEDGYAVSAKVSNISQTLASLGSRVTIWGVPADPGNDSVRAAADPVSGVGIGNNPANPFLGAKSASPRQAFVSAPTSCTGEALETRLSAVSWQQPGLIHTASFDTDFDGAPIVNEGCGRLGFVPSMDAQPTATAADAPTGLNVDIQSPQNIDSPDGLANAHLRDVEVDLPDGLTINPSSATGLEACSDAQLGLGNDERIQCPLGSKIGSAVARTPVLEEAIEGGVYLRPQASDDPESGDMFRLALVMENRERGILVKLPGNAKADSDTGKITASFKDNPQLPVESIKVSLKSGPRAPLATPASCGSKTIGVGMSSWAGHDRDLSDGFSVDCPGIGGFAPSFAAGSVNPVGGDSSPFVVRISRQDREQYIDGAEVDLPEGVLAKLAGVPLCSDADANAGTCGAGSRVGSATVGAGPGSNPFHLKDQPVYLAGAYKGAPYSLSVAARAVAGPFDLGMVVVRQALHVDPETAQVKVVSDPVPTIVKGVPLRLRSIDVSVDRPDFARNPTSCAVKQVTGRLHSQQGSSHTGRARFQVGECRSLAFRPKLAMRLTGRKQTKTGGHPSLKAVVSQGKGQANIGKASVTLPKSVVLDAVNSYDPKLVCDYDASLKANCPASSVIGKASARTPLLDKPLTGRVHLVQGIKFGPNGNRIRTTPSLLVKLRGQVAINLRARTTVRDDRLVTTFPKVPDAQVSRFAMTVKGGKTGILVVTRTRRAKIDICSSKQTAAAALDGHNGRNADYNTTIKTPCAKASKATRKGSSRRSNRR